jgi:hypothetical protein
MRKRRNWDMHGNEKVFSGTIKVQVEACIKGN